MHDCLPGGVVARVADADHDLGRGPVVHPAGRTEDRHAGLIDRGGSERRSRIQDGGRSARENHASRPHPLEGFLRRVEGNDLAIDLFLAHAPRDQLGHLRAEIDDEDLVVLGWPLRCGGRLRRCVDQRHRR